MSETTDAAANLELAATYIRRASGLLDDLPSWILEHVEFGNVKGLEYVDGRMATALDDLAKWLPDLDEERQEAADLERNSGAA